MKECAIQSPEVSVARNGSLSGTVTSAGFEDMKTCT